ncbi:Acyl-coenzyme A:6-aminopenicillanic acid acyl-transferase [Stieleria maiorica]|uniref:Acyl-coenzyme A:6-aminopenicillanic acid acyl-transferase n=1 Tax=Stieleria maiorica TaxID=2795974 RepID=A0A5B9ML08_9BACT|nr:C45 family peptidase [Stieleria maiorica]QEG00365.1 Acyl-coenzyme A:6-aminopenicillanic acid acyl-transferase [Stieleria maiorica]
MLQRFSDVCPTGRARLRRVPSAILFALVLLSSPVLGADVATTTDPLTERLQPYLRLLSGQQQDFEIRCRAEVPIDGNRQTIRIRLARQGMDSFDLDLEHRDYEARIRRREDGTALALPKHNVVFVGRGQASAADSLAPGGLTQRLVSTRTTVSTYLPLLAYPDASAVTAALKSLAGMTYDAQSRRGRLDGSATFAFEADGSLVVRTDDAVVTLAISAPSATPPGLDDWPGLTQSKVPREELERTLVRGVRRALEILAPSKVLTSPSQAERQTDHGRLQWIDGHRVVLLSGSPAEIGRAHGELLADPAQACIDSVLHTFGTVQTIRTGRWFRHDLDAAFARLSPHIPQRHRIETRAMARALGLDEDLVDSLNVFPELFHCSGFAVFGDATGDGKLYHGRVLDYMTTIGLQDAATTFIVAADGQIPFANVGYAGFIGSVSGMNAEAISLGEMGGGGEGKWDGVPMATLMRRALEECRTLDEVMTLWRESPRTCEYYYVFADGKTNRAVGVAADPDSIEFIQPGQADPRLGDGIDDAIVLSAGDRLKTLRERVHQKHGQIDAEVGKWLMSRPVAMQSNLHNVLFVPADQVMYVANADHRHPAAERPYVRLDLDALLRSMGDRD